MLPRRRGGVNAVLLAAGYGTRTRSPFPDTPKALIEVGGHALIDHPLASLARSDAPVDPGRHQRALSRRPAAPLGRRARRRCPPA